PQARGRAAQARHHFSRHVGRGDRRGRGRRLVRRKPSRSDPGRRVPDQRRRHDPRRRERPYRVLRRRHDREVTLLARRHGAGHVGARIASHAGQPGAPAGARAESDRYLAELIRVVADSAVKITPQGPNWPATESPTDTELFRAIVAAAHARDPDAFVTTPPLTGFTDSHYFRRLGIVSYGVSPFPLNQA